jgi:hypothetical protein
MKRRYQQMLYSIAVCIFVADCAPTSTTSVQIIEARLIHPRSISVSPQGAVYVADDDGRLFPEKGWLYAVSPDETKVIELGDLIPWSIATDAQGNIYASMMPLLDKGIYKIDPRTGPTRLWTATYAKAITVAANGDIYVIDSLAANDDRIVKVARDGLATVVASHLQNTAALSVDRFDNLYVSDYSSIFVIRPDGQKATIARHFCAATSLANDSGGEVYVVDQGRWQILKVTLNGAVSRIGSGFRDPVGLAFDAHDSGYVIEVGNSGVKKFSLSNVRQTAADLEGSCSANPLTVAD